MSAALTKPRAYSASMTEKVKLTWGGSVPETGAGASAAPATCQSSLIVVIASMSQACPAASPGSASCAALASAPAGSAAPNWNPVMFSAASSIGS